MNTKEFLNKVSKEIKYKPANKSITEELESHIEEAKKDYFCKGYSTNEAEEMAVEQMGDAKKIGKMLNKIHRPKLDWMLIGLIIILPATILAVVIIFMCVRIVKNSKKVNDIYGKYLIIGLGTTYIMQAIIHVLMNLKLWIRSDVNLPFVAEGSLYLLINCFTFAVILSVYRRKDINFEPKKLIKFKNIL